MKHLRPFGEFNLLLESDQKAIDQSTKEVDDLLRELEKSGKDIKDKEIQKDLIAKIIDSDFNIDEIDVEEIKENNHPINESHGSIGGLMHLIAEFIDNTELGENLAHKLNIKKEKIQWIFTIIKKIIHGAVWILELVEKAIFKVCRFMGIGIETSKATSTATMAIIGITCFIFAIIHAGPEVATLAGIGLAIKLSVIMIKGWASIKSFYVRAKDVFHEAKRANYTINDFLDEIGPTVKKLGGKEFDTNTIFALDKWYDSLQNRRSDVEYYFKQIIKISNSEHANNPQQKHKVENYINNLMKKVDEKQKEVVEFFKGLKQLLIGNSPKMKTI